MEINFSLNLVDIQRHHQLKILHQLPFHNVSRKNYIFERPVFEKYLSIFINNNYFLTESQ